MELGSLADWVGGIGSILAIGGIWWQSHEESKKLKVQFDREDQLRDELNKQSKISQKKQDYKECIQHLENINSELILLRGQIAHKKKYPTTIHNHLVLLNIMIKTQNASAI